MTAYVCNPRTRRADVGGFKVSQGYTVSSRIAWVRSCLNQTMVGCIGEMGPLCPLCRLPITRMNLTRKTVYSGGSHLWRWESKSQIHLPKNSVKQLLCVAAWGREGKVGRLSVVRTHVTNFINCHLGHIKGCHLYPGGCGCEAGVELGPLCMPAQHSAAELHFQL